MMQFRLKRIQMVKWKKEIKIKTDKKIKISVYDRAFWHLKPGPESDWMNFLSHLLPRPAKKRAKYLSHQEKPSVLFFALLLMNMCCLILQNSCYATSKQASLAVSIVYKLTGASRFHQNWTTPVANSSFSSKDADWFGHILAGHKWVKVELLKMNLRLEISAVQLPCKVMNASKMTPLCLAGRLSLLSVLPFFWFLMSVIWSVSPLQVYDHLTLLNNHDSLGKWPICCSDGHSKMPPYRHIYGVFPAGCLTTIATENAESTENSSLN